jgi:periplasmic protein TonB
MFEQSVISQTHRRPWALGISFTMETALVGGLVLLSVLHVDKLPPLDMHIMVPYPKIDLKEAVTLVRTETMQQQPSISMPRPFYAPARIPQTVDHIVDQPSMGSAPPLGSSIGIPNSGLFGIVGTVPMEHAQPALPPPPPAQVQPAPPKQLVVSSGVAEAMIVKRIIPTYPPLAKASRVSGKVHLMGIIGKDGTIQNLQVLDGHPLLVKAAVDAVKQWIYKPTTLNGSPVDVIAPIEVNFVLN